MTISSTGRLNESNIFGSPNAKADAFLEYFGLGEQPFGVTPDPRFLYLGSKHSQALAALDYGTRSNRGFLALIAQPGMGKTSLLYQYLESLRDSARTAFVFQTDGNSSDFMRYVLADLELDATGKDLSEMRAMLNNVLLAEMHAGRRFVLVIDEAQNLDENALESIRLLSNFETPWAKLMQIVMAGQPQLAERLGRASMAQLRQRISFFIKLEPFVAEETDAYIFHRLQIAGYTRDRLFTPGAVRLISEYSKGTPRTINNVCFAAMSLAWMLRSKAIDRDTITDVLADLSPGLPTKTTASTVESEGAKEGVPPVRFSAGGDLTTPSSSPSEKRSLKHPQGRIQGREPKLVMETISHTTARWPLSLAITIFLLLAIWWFVSPKIVPLAGTRIEPGSSSNPQISGPMRSEVSSDLPNLQAGSGTPGLHERVDLTETHEGFREH